MAVATRARDIYHSRDGGQTWVQIAHAGEGIAAAPRPIAPAHTEAFAEGKAGVDMQCSACVVRLEGIEATLVGVTRVTASYRKQQMEVEYDPQRLTVTEIIAAVQRHGYEAIPR